MIVDYRKMRNGKEFMKVLDKSKAISVLFSGPIQTILSGRIIVTTNQTIVRDYFNAEVSEPSSEKEFEKHYNVVKEKLDQFIDVKKNRY